MLRLRSLFRRVSAATGRRFTFLRLDTLNGRQFLRRLALRRPFPVRRDQLVPGVCRDRKDRKAPPVREVIPECRGPAGPRGFQGPQGPQGPRGFTGESGSPAVSGAGNIAFLYFYPACGNVYVLDRNGGIWEAAYLAGGSGWKPVSPRMRVPVATTDIVSWQLFSFLDRSGNVWWWTGESGREEWHNLSAPPSVLR
jgi:hypothetical protein